MVEARMREQLDTAGFRAFESEWRKTAVESDGADSNSNSNDEDADSVVEDPADEGERRR